MGRHERCWSLCIVGQRSLCRSHSDIIGAVSPQLGLADRLLCCPSRPAVTLFEWVLVGLGAKAPGVWQVGRAGGRGKIKVIETDASKLGGWSYHVCSAGRVCSGVWPAHFGTTEALANANDINYKELWVEAHCLESEGVYLRGWRVLFRIDNTAAVHYVNVRYGRIPSLEALDNRFEVAESRAQCWALAMHLEGARNLIADAGSRDPTFAHRWASDAYRDARIRPDFFEDAQRRCGVIFTMDLFSDREGRNAMAASWRCPERTAFEADLRGNIVWAHPPRSLLAEVLTHLNAALRNATGLHIVLLAPEDAGPPWFRPTLLRRWFQVRCWPAGSDLFRWYEHAAEARWRRGP